jgi:hypothetical protein
MKLTLKKGLVAAGLLFALAPMAIVADDEALTPGSQANPPVPNPSVSETSTPAKPPVVVNGPAKNDTTDEVDNLKAAKKTEKKKQQKKKQQKKKKKTKPKSNMPNSASSGTPMPSTTLSSTSPIDSNEPFTDTTSD